jgi:type IV pilus assembly protein PilV
MKTQSVNNLANYQTGFTMVEVLIALFILSIGLLGMAGIQVQGLRGTTSSTMRSQATILANDIAERARINTAAIQAAADESVNEYSQVNTDDIACLDEGTYNPLCSATSGGGDVDTCTSRQMAEADLYVFACGMGNNGGVKNLLPGGSATITCNPLPDAGGVCVPGSSLTVTISWTDVNPQAGDQELKTHTLVFIP